MVALVRRWRCPRCGEGRFVEKPLPSTGVVLALTSAGVKVEQLDQVTGRQAACLLDLGDGNRLACLVAHADAGRLLGALHGARLRLVVRRTALGGGDPEAPIEYGIKAAADVRTRTAAKNRAGRSER
jgi:hypothetical protein